MRLLTFGLALWAWLAPAVGSSAGYSGPETPLDAHRRAALLTLDRVLNADSEDTRFPTPNLGLEQDRSEQDYQDKVAAILGLVDMGVAPRARLAEANRLLRYEMLGRWPITAPTQLEGDSGIWMHRSRTLGMRLYLLYSHYMDSDIQSEYQKRLEWLAREPYVRLSENIKLTNNSSYFLAHEILGRTDAPSYRNVRNWLVHYLKNHGRAGTHEWGSTYNTWTFLAVLNLAEFARDEEIRSLATMVIDYDLARAIVLSIRGYFCSPAVRRYYFWTVNGYVLPQTQLNLLLFASSGTDPLPVMADFALSNYAPLSIHQALFDDERPCEAWFWDDSLSGTGKQWRIHFYRGHGVALATHQTVERDYYALPSGGTHDIIGCFIQSAKGPANSVVPYGYEPGSVPKKKRNMDERYFSYKNMAFVNMGGTTRAVWAKGRFPRVPARLFYYKDFTCEISGGWAFLTDGVAYVAWAPTKGDPVHDPRSRDFSDPVKEGAWLRSTYVPGDEGETCIVEVGDAELFGDLAGFKKDILKRNPRPRVNEGKVTYRAKDGARLEFGSGYVKVGEEYYDPAAHPRAEGPGIHANELAVPGGGCIVFDFDTGTTKGSASRIRTSMVFGAPRAVEP